MPALPTPADMVAKWKNRVQAAGPAYAAGTLNCTVNPMQLAVAQQAKMVANWQQSVNSGRWASRTNAVPVATWKAQCGLAQNKYTQGALTGEGKYTTFANKAIPVYTQMRAAANNAGNDPIARSSAALAVLIAAGRKAGGTAFV